MRLNGYLLQMLQTKMKQGKREWQAYWINKIAQGLRPPEVSWGWTRGVSEKFIGSRTDLGDRQLGSCLGGSTIHEEN